MIWELYEVWAEDEDGYEELVDTTKSLKEARELAVKTLDDFSAAIIYQETEDGETEEVERLTVDESGAIITQLS